MKKPVKLMFVFGTRPEAIKMAPIVSQLSSHSKFFKNIVVTTGQHRQMLDQVLKAFSLKADHDLDIMRESQSVSQIVQWTLKGLDQLLAQDKPDMLLVQGDTSTAFAAGLCSFYHRIPVAHVEAGLRTGDKWRPYPEEMNRLLISRVADLHFAPTKTSLKNLLAEKCLRKDIYVTGNTVIDALMDIVDRPFDLNKIGLKLEKGKKIILVTAHRRESLGKPLENIFKAIKDISIKFKDDVQIIFPVHLNPKVRLSASKILDNLSNVSLIPPMDYEPFAHLMKASYLILTDSGGIQEEAPSLGKPVLVLREKTERPEAILANTVKLVGVSRDNIVLEASKLLSSTKKYNKMARAINPYGDGKAAERIILAMKYYFGFAKCGPREFK